MRLTSGRPSRTLDITSVILGGEYLASGLWCPVIPEQLNQLCKVCLSREYVLDSALVEVKPVSRELETILTQPPFEVREKTHGRFLGSFSNLEAGHQLGFRCPTLDEHPLIAQLRGIVFANATGLLADKAPYFVALQVVRTNVANGIEYQQELFAAVCIRERMVPLCSPVMREIPRMLIPSSIMESAFAATSGAGVAGSEGFRGVGIGKGGIAGTKAPALILRLP